MIVSHHRNLKPQELKEQQEQYERDVEEWPAKVELAQFLSHPIPPHPPRKDRQGMSPPTPPEDPAE